MRSTDLDLSNLSEEELNALIFSDDELYAEMLLFIKAKNLKVVPFLYNEPQRLFTKACDEQLLKHGRVQMIVLKARQMGLSTAIQGRGFKRATTTENFSMVNISHDDDSVQHIFGMSTIFLEELHARFKPMVRYSPRTELYFANENPKKFPIAQYGAGLRSSIRTATAKNANVGRSKTIHFGHFSEVAFWRQNAKELIDGFLQSIPEAPRDPSASWVPTEVYIESTANGPEGYFYELWREAVVGNNEWFPLFIPWWQMREYRKEPRANMVYTKDEEELLDKYPIDDHQLQWRRDTLATKCSNDLQLFKQEYPADWREAFQSSAVSFFPVSLLETQLSFLEKQPTPRRGRVERQQEKDAAGAVVKSSIIFVDDPEGNCILHSEPDPAMAYVLAADAAEGTEDEEHDPSGFLVTSAPSDPSKISEEVFEYNGTLDPDQQADLMALVGEWYNWAFEGWEDNNHGMLITRRLGELGYAPVYEREQYDEQTGEVTMKVGFHTTQATKPLILDLYKQGLREGTLRPRTAEACYELLTFKKSKVAHKSGLYSGKAQAKGTHDERVMIRALTALLLTVCPRVPPERSTGSEQDLAAEYAER